MTALTAAQGMTAIADVLIRQDTRTTLEKLESLSVGSHVIFGADRHAYKSGVEYKVIAVDRVSATRFDLALLESGKPASELKAGKYLAKGKMISTSNIIHTTWYANAKNYGGFAIV